MKTTLESLQLIAMWLPSTPLHRWCLRQQLYLTKSEGWQTVSTGLAIWSLDFYPRIMYASSWEAKISISNNVSVATIDQCTHYRRAGVHLGSEAFLTICHANCGRFSAGYQITRLKKATWPAKSQRIVYKSLWKWKVTMLMKTQTDCEMFKTKLDFVCNDGIVTDRVLTCRKPCRRTGFSFYF